MEVMISIASCAEKESSTMEKVLLGNSVVRSRIKCEKAKAVKLFELQRSLVNERLDLDLASLT